MYTKNICVGKIRESYVNFDQKICASVVNPDLWCYINKVKILLVSLYRRKTQS